MNGKLDLDQQLRSGIDMIQDAFLRQQTQLKHEVNHYKHLAQERKEHEQLLETQVHNLTRRVSELEHALSAATNDKKNLLASKNALMDRYTALKQSATQLEAFRKNMIQMVQSIPGAPLSFSTDQDSLQENNLEQTLRASQGSRSNPLINSNGSRNNLVTSNGSRTNTNNGSRERLEKELVVSNGSRPETNDFRASRTLRTSNTSKPEPPLEDISNDYDKESYLEEKSVLGLRSLDIVHGLILDQRCH
ncbi:hypothetical protein EDD86DRAFT_212123 [Gorgonomyces haynaldii]|nr:hypothetical protein EDD86DRAFT_212123 [Gorgonomyces haynaldii]